MKIMSKLVRPKHVDIYISNATGIIIFLKFNDLVGDCDIEIFFSINVTVTDYGIEL